MHQLMKYQISHFYRSRKRIIIPSLSDTTLYEALRVPRDPTQMPGTIKPFFIEINTFIEKQKYPLVAN